MQQICTSGSMSGERKRSNGMDCDTGSGRKPPVTQKPQTCRRRAAPRLYRPYKGRLRHARG
jgi:hypothetical protein